MDFNTSSTDKCSVFAFFLPSAILKNAVSYFSVAARINNTVHCDTKVRLPATVVSVPVGLPINKNIHQAMSYLFQGSVADGEYAKLSTKSYLNYTKNVCVERDAAAEVVQFDLVSMIGPLMLLLIVSTVSLIITRIGQRAEKQAKEIRAIIDTDGACALCRHVHHRTPPCSPVALAAPCARR